jgi:CO/xanthine dehydrogenase FAD-binding subunit
VEVLRPRDLEEALAMRRDHACTPLAGGTDVMVELNFDRHRPEAILDLTGVGELRESSRIGDALRIGAGATYVQLMRDHAESFPSLALAARTVGSPQIRNRGTIGGNLGAASPAGDCHPALLAAGAEIELRSTDEGTRRVPAAGFFIGPKRSVLRADELITAVHVRTAPGPQQFAKVGTRNAMVIAVCSFAIALDPVSRRVGTGIGSAGPTPLQAPEAERFLEGAVDEADAWEDGTLPDAVVARFGELAAAAATPIDDVRGSAAYRCHALDVLAQRTLRWSLSGLERSRAA